MTLSKYVIAALCGWVMFTLLIVFGVVDWYNTSVALENGVKAQWLENKNSYSAFSNKVIEAAGVTEEYERQFRAILHDTMTSRYTEQGSTAAIRLVSEHNPNLDVRAFTNLQSLIEIGRDSFEREQRSLLDRQRRYQDHLGMFGGSKLAQVFGFPRPVGGNLAPPNDLDGDGRRTVLDYPIILSETTKNAFATGQDESVKPFAP